jgi:hypothetical protein
MTSRRSPELEKVAAVVFGARGKWRAKERENWEDKEPVKVMSQKRGGEGACTGGCCDGEVADGRAAGRRGTRAREPGRRS